MNSFMWAAVEWHYDEMPESNPYKKYLVVYAPWDRNRSRETEAQGQSGAGSRCTAEHL